MGYLGDDFVGIDNDAVGDGAADTLPVDTWVQNRIAGNQMWLAQGHTSFCWSPVQRNSDHSALGGDWPYASITNWISIGLWDLPVAPGLEGVTLSGIYAADAGDVDLRVRVGETVVDSVVSSTADVGDYASFVIDIDIDPRDAPESAEVVRFEVYMRSRLGSARSGTASVYIAGPVADTANTTFFDNGASANPAFDSLEIQCLANDYGTGYADLVDMMGRLPADVAGNDRMSVVPPRDWPTSGDRQRYYLSYLQLRSLSVQPRFAETSYSVPKREEIEARQAFSGVAAGRHQRGSLASYMRPRVIRVGPEGYYSSTEEQWSALGYSRRWRYAPAEDSGAAATTAIIDDSIWLDATESDVEVRLKLVAVQYEQSGGLRGAVRWDLTAALEQLATDTTAAAWEGSATMTDIATITQSPSLRMWPVGFPSVPFVLQALQVMRVSTVGTTDGFAFREGSVWWEDAADRYGDVAGTEVSVIDDVVIRLRAPAADGDRALPFRLRVTAALGDDVTYCSGYQRGDDEHLELVLVGYTIIERPRV